MIRRLVSLILVMSMMVLLVACGKEQESNKENKTENTVQEGTTYKTEDDAKVKSEKHEDTLDEKQNTVHYNISEDVAVKSEKRYQCSNGIERLEYETLYDEQGNIIENINYYDDGSKLIDENEIDKYGNITSMKSTIYDAEGEFDEETIFSREFTYDNNGNVVEEKGYDNGALSYITKLEYDEDNNLINREEDHISFMITYTYEYDEAGNMVAEKTNHDGYEVGEKWTYDENGNVLTWIRQEGNGFSQSQEYTYDEWGRVIKHTDYESSIEFEYDELGNLVKETYENGEYKIWKYEGEQDNFSLSEIHQDQAVRSLSTYVDGKMKEKYNYNPYDEEWVEGEYWYYQYTYYEDSTDSE